MIQLASLFLFLFLIPTFFVVQSTYKFVRFLKRSPQPIALQDGKLPSVAIVMSVRGLDPSLKDCIHSLLTQDYPNYLIKIVVDSKEDTAWDLLHQISQDASHGNIELLLLNVRYDTCGLKCSALIQAISQLDPDLDVVAFIDSDVIAHPTWLRELVTPLANPKVGLTSGLPWYLPKEENVGSLVRYLWNIYGVTGRYICRTPSGASMAIQRHLLTQEKILGVWQKVLSEDITAAVMIEDEGLEIQFIPSLIMVNRESCTLQGCWQFVKRQFFWTRLYSPQWTFIATQAFFRLIVLLSAALLLPISLLKGDSLTTMVVIGGLAIYFVSIGISIFSIQKNVQGKLIERGEVLAPCSAFVFPKLVFSFLIAHLIVLGGTLSALGMQSIQWREINYQIENKLDIRMLEYSPYKGSNPKSNASIL